MQKYMDCLQIIQAARDRTGSHTPGPLSLYIFLFVFNLFHCQLDSSHNSLVVVLAWKKNVFFHLLDLSGVNISV